MMKIYNKYLVIVLAFLSVFLQRGYAQFTTLSSGFTINAGTTFSFSGFSITPSTTLTISNNTLSLSSTAVTSGSLSSIDRVYSFTSPITYSGDVQINYQSGELNGNTESLLEIAYKSLATGGTWSISTGSTQGTPGTYIVSNSFTSTNMAHITAFDDASLLPIVLQSFTGKSTSGGNVLNWSTSLELNAREMQLERSADGRQYSKITSIAAKGQPAAYSYTDAKALGTQFYRLRLVDKDGSAAYSQVVKLTSVATSLRLQVYPNPASQQLQLNSNAKAGTVKLYNVLGNVVLQQSWKPGQSIAIGHLPAGTYVVELTELLHTTRERVVKQ